MARQRRFRLVRSVAIHACLGYAIGIVIALVLAVVQIGPEPKPAAWAVSQDQFGRTVLNQYAGVGFSYSVLCSNILMNEAYGLPPQVPENRVFAVRASLSARGVDVSDEYRCLVEARLGWPLRSMWYCARFGRAPSDPRYDEIAHVRAVVLRFRRGPIPFGEPWRRSTFERNAIVLPTGILLGGSIANGLLFGAITFAMCRVKPLVRPARGKCAGCGYTITGQSVCPECGREVRRRCRVHSMGG